jgi:hypothetical protein
MENIKATLSKADKDEIASAAQRIGLSIAAFVRLAALKLARESK